MNIRKKWLIFLVGMLLTSVGCTRNPVAITANKASVEYDIIIQDGLVYDGSGGKPFVADIGIRGDKVAAMGDLAQAKAKTTINAKGLAVAPGFINVLSHSWYALVLDGRSQSDIRQGVTLEVFGESSMGPLNKAMQLNWAKEEVALYGSSQEAAKRLGIKELKGDSLIWPWTTLGEHLEYLQNKGVAPNIASFVSAGTIRVNILGYENRPPTPQELDRMRALVRQSMEEGALGVTSALIYAPSTFATTAELVTLCKEAAPYGGSYISHMRSEGDRLLEALDELISIAREANIGAEVYHLKVGGSENWKKMDEAIDKIEAARTQGLKITADVYPYIAGTTGFDASMPPWVQEGGFGKWWQRLQDPTIRAQVAELMRQKADKWENLLLLAGPDRVLLTGFQKDKLRHLIGKTLAQVAIERGATPEETAMDLVVEDSSRVEVTYFTMSEDNLRKQIKQPWVSFCSDAPSMAAEGDFLLNSMHPRAYGSFARVLGKYVREEGLISLEEAIRRLTFLPATNFKLVDRGLLVPGYFADVVVFDPNKVQDHATFEQPHQYSTGMLHVFVNGKQVLKNGEHTGALPGRVVRGPGWKPKK